MDRWMDGWTDGWLKMREDGAEALWCETLKTNT